MFCICEWPLSICHCCPILSICWLGFAFPSLFLSLCKENNGSTCNLEKPEPLLCADSPCINISCMSGRTIALCCWCFPIRAGLWPFIRLRAALMKLLFGLLGIRLALAFRLFPFRCDIQQCLMAIRNFYILANLWLIHMNLYILICIFSHHLLSPP